MPVRVRGPRAPEEASRGGPFATRCLFIARHSLTARVKGDPLEGRSKAQQRGGGGLGVARVATRRAVCGARRARCRTAGAPLLVCLGRTSPKESESSLVLVLSLLAVRPRRRAPDAWRCSPGSTAGALGSPAASPEPRPVRPEAEGLEEGTPLILFKRLPAGPDQAGPAVASQESLSVRSCVYACAALRRHARTCMTHEFVRLRVAGVP